ncbi:MAG: DUF4258 domain-containing protein [Phycisphaeraceae bacterium]|nr:MAG: DUF4258 domain-containing protein [Phycisphaeraceae bacterium]
MNIRLYIDPETAQPHIFRHGVREHEVEEVLARPMEDRSGREGSRVAIGRTRSGRYLRIIYVPDSRSNGVFIITAYDLKGKPLAAFKRRMRRKPK